MTHIKVMFQSRWVYGVDLVQKLQENKTMNLKQNLFNLAKRNDQTKFRVIVTQVEKNVLFIIR